MTATAKDTTTVEEGRVLKVAEDNKKGSPFVDLRKRLDEKIPRDVIAKRDGGGGRQLDYLEGWYVISRMNEVFGQGNWHYTTDSMTNVFTGEINGKHTTHYVAQVSVYAMGVRFSDFGYGDGSDKFNPGKAHELAVKEAVTDGIKRAAKNFGFSMGLALYDKTRENVEDEAVAVKPKAGAGNSKRAKADKSEGVPDAAVTAPTGSPATGTDGTSAPTSKATLSATAKNRADVNAFLTSVSRNLVSKRKYTVEKIREYMSTKYGVAVKEELTDAQATEFLDFLDTENNT